MIPNDQGTQHSKVKPENQMDIRNSDEGKTENNPSNLLRASDVARRLNISRSLAYQLLQQGVIPVVRIGKLIRVLEGDLEAFIFNSRTTGLV